MSDDLISRQAAIDDAHRQIWYRMNPSMKERIDKWLSELPAVQPKQKTGQWMINSDGCYPYCSRCKREPRSRIMTKYCAECGAFMEA